MSLFNQLPHITSRIETFTPGGQSSIGTGFFFNFEVPDRGIMTTLITNKHVVEDATKAKVYFSRANGNEALFGQFNSWDIEGFNEVVVGHPDPNVDLAAFPVGAIITEMEKAGTPAYYRGLSAASIPNEEDIASLTAIENILMVGYPTGLWDQTNNLPIIRRGITATPYARDYGGRPEFMIDCACFPGSSGSPVMIAENGAYTMKDGSIGFGSRFYLLGLLWGGPQYTAEGEIVAKPVPTSTVPVSLSRIPTNLGFCVKSRMIKDLLPILIDRFP